MPSKYLNTVEQDLVEHEAFLSLLRDASVESYLEVGCKNGGTLWRTAKSLPIGSRIVAIDLPWGDKATEPHLVECCAELRKCGYDVHLHLGSSTRPEAIEFARARGPYDAVFIDGNHTLPYVQQDWKNYGPMGKIVAFHDIGWKMWSGRAGKLPIDVPIFWEELKSFGGYRFQEISRCPRDNGIGIVWK
jgi:hypothetical protein